MKVCFLLTHIPNPRINKRIEQLKKTYYVSVICVCRMGQNIWEPTQNVRHEILAMAFPDSRHMIKRYIASNGFKKKAIKKLKELEPDIIYAEGFDCLIIAGKYKRHKNVHIVYEAADLREVFIRKPRQPLERLLTELLLLMERREFHHVELLVVTSPKFHDVHFHKLVSKEKTVFLPNTPEKKPFRDYRKKTTGEFTVGFIGGIRYVKQMKMLVDAAGMAECRVLFAGGCDSAKVSREIQEYCRNKDYVSFTGKYDYTTQIAGLYGSVDCVFAVYDADNPNVRIALPNKLYESIICGLPIISAKNTYLGELTEQWGVGLTVRHTDTEALCGILKKLRDDRNLYDSISENCGNRKRDIDPKKGNVILMKAIERMPRIAMLSTLIF